MYIEKPMRFFLDRLCSNSPAPGGGSASALTGATAASLSGMLAALTVNKKGYEQVKPEMEEILSKAESLKEELLDLLQKDTEAFNDASKAFKLPKGTEDEKKRREKAVEGGLKKATEVPLNIMEKSLEVALDLAMQDGRLSTLKMLVERFKNVELDRNIPEDADLLDKLWK